MNQFKENYKVNKGPELINATVKRKNGFYPFYDEQGNCKGRVNKVYEIVQNNWLKGVAVILHTEKGKIVVEERTNTTLNPNQLDVISGHIEGNETEMQAAYREIKEEVGILPEQVKNLRKVGKAVSLDFAGRKFIIQFLSADIETKDMKITQETKKECRRTFTLEQEEFIQYIQNNKMKFEYIGNEEKYKSLIDYLSIPAQENKKGMNIEK